MNDTNIDEWKQIISLISLISDNAGVNNEIGDLVFQSSTHIFKFWHVVYFRSWYE